MLISVLGFGSIWTLRSVRKARAQERFDTRELAYYNTTGVEVGGKLRNRPRVYGVARFNGNSGFRPECWHRMLYKVFDCEPPCTWNGHQKVLFKRLLRKPETTGRVPCGGEIGTDWGRHQGRRLAASRNDLDIVQRMWR